MAAEPSETIVADAMGAAMPRESGPGAGVVLETSRAKVVAFAFAPGQELREHAARHPVLIHGIEGDLELTLPDEVVQLRPGVVVHLAPMVRHSVSAPRGGRLTVTMLLPGE
ncbi:hypothetical protein HT102_03315 [Hoyosella sp. G463]|uniref:Cupin domain-containing protein n=1 Tax=Lolliginicoccus lacisalsi TaxID=2742202 RepID=A0A927PK21_9ACTN|nr:hypothetical protein [Lolliginicoccus lacisalsi]MBD8505520.1 hypothetical protein [Lolliginicoccus lacisalsi]